MDMYFWEGVWPVSVRFELAFPLSISYDLNYLLAFTQKMITFEEFKKIELKVGKIREVSRIEGSEKLVRLAVDIGGEERKIIAGVGRRYDPETLVGKEIVIVANLEPKSIMGLESQGMLLAADDNGPVLISPDQEVPPGTIIR